MQRKEGGESVQRPHQAGPGFDGCTLPGLEFATQESENLGRLGLKPFAACSPVGGKSEGELA